MIPLTMRNLEESKSERQKIEGWLSGAGGMGLVHDECRVSVCKDEKVLEMDDGDGSTTLRLYVIPLN